MRKLIRLALLGVCLALSCLHDLDVPLTNSTPAVVAGLSGDTLAGVLSYPDSVVGTLTVSDLNDSALGIDTMSWPGGWSQLDSSLSAKRLRLWLPSDSLSLGFAGELVIVDGRDGCARVPYRLERIFYDRMNACPPLPAYWDAYDYDSADSAYMRLRAVPFVGLEFYFGDSAADSASTMSLVSAMSLHGDFRWSLDYWLKENMRSGFELSFTVSAGRDTSWYAGDRAGVALIGRNNALVIKYFDAFFTGTSYGDESYYYGPVRFTRTAGALRIEHRLPSGGYREVTDVPLTFPDFDSAFVHVRMAATDFTEERFCTFSGLTIDQGRIGF